MDALEQKFSQMVREHKTTIYTVCYMFSKEEDEVNDLFQEVLINLWKGYEGFQGMSDVKTWIYRVSLNTCISQDRKKKSRKKAEVGMNVGLLSEGGENSKQIRMLHERINRLEIFDRAIILLWLENQSYEEIAAIVGISVKNVSVRLLRIKKKLMEMSND
ncbi:MAG: sigma-70 family RNA polymerase sigma factor [Bacteroidales bacterium]|nr:sigma-70 family RNA polymerase sigma factor [Bacteroidaceae bacterium]MBQ9885128.1 sigma-70 family RNA polymerase sigma factor [Bacteroidaceae bacterium]MDO4186972.1 sigma-70 family RNA polymerase sigma factor [Bacteroidales bacterium]